MKITKFVSFVYLMHDELIRLMLKFKILCIYNMMSVEGVCGVCVVDGWFTASPA